MFLRIFAALSSSSEVYTPIFLGLESKFMKIIPTCLSCVQKLASSAAVGEVWSYHFSYLSNEIVLKRQCKAYLRNYLIIPLDKIMLFHTCTWMKIRFDCFYTFVKFLLTKLFFLLLDSFQWTVQHCIMLKEEKMWVVFRSHWLYCRTFSCTKFYSFFLTIRSICALSKFHNSFRNVLYSHLGYWKISSSVSFCTEGKSSRFSQLIPFSIPCRYTQQK